MLTHVVAAVLVFAIVAVFSLFIVFGKPHEPLLQTNTPSPRLVYKGTDGQWYPVDRQKLCDMLAQSGHPAQECR